MASLFPVVSLLVVIVVSLLVVRVATVALVLTGLSQQLARFQARSAFTGAGFTTSESEKVTQHPVRRRIVMGLMLMGNAGIVTAVSSLILSFVNTSESSEAYAGLRLMALIAGVTGLWVLAQTEWVDRQLTKTIEAALKRWTDLEVRDYSGLLHLSRGYSVVEMEVEPGDWLAQRELAGLRLADEGVLMLGVECADGNFLGAPRGKTKLSPGDTVIMYGPSDLLANLDERREGSDGNWDHHKAVDRQRKLESGEIEEPNATVA